MEYELGTGSHFSHCNAFLRRNESFEKTRENGGLVLGPIKIALRPRIVTDEQISDLETYSSAMWTDSMRLEEMWHAGELEDYIEIEEEELAIARMQPWKGGPAIFAADGLFGFGAHLEKG